MKTIYDIILESKSNKDKNIYSFKEFRKFFYTEEKINVNSYWNMELEIYSREIDNIDKWYVMFGNRKRDFNFEYMGEKEKSQKLKSCKVSKYTNGIYIQFDKSWLIVTEKPLINIFK